MPEDQLTQEAQDRAKKVGISTEHMREALLAERAGKPYIVELEHKFGGSFYRCTQEGPSRILYLNVEHPFFVNCYMAPGSNAEFRTGVEVLLWTLGTAELDADEDKKKLYVQERVIWSRYLANALPELAKLMDFDSARDEEDLKAEELEARMVAAEEAGLEPTDWQK
jgi:hypothetical protein